jgi:hypothetical protein
VNQNPLLIFLISVLMTSTVSGKSVDGWGKMGTFFYEPLTSLQKDWRSDDWGADASSKERAILSRFRPRIYITPDSYYPIDFYRDYVAYAQLKDDQGNVLVEGPSPQQLKNVERHHGVYLDFKGDFLKRRLRPNSTPNPVIYGRIIPEVLHIERGAKTVSKPVLVLKYNSVFAASGLPSKMSLLKQLLSHMAGDPEIWHELDIHGAVQVIVDKETLKPYLVLLAQHNHFRTYIVGEDLEWPSDNRIKIAFSNRSNEPYLSTASTKSVAHYATGDPKNIRFVFTGKKRDISCAEDIVFGHKAGGLEVDAKLAYLRTKDPLYTAWINLGDRKKILGIFPTFYRDGPPGINMNRWPQLKSYLDISRFYYFDKNDPAIFDLYEKHVKGFEKADLSPVMEINKKRFNKVLSQIFFP